MVNSFLTETSNKKNNDLSSSSASSTVTLNNKEDLKDLENQTYYYRQQPGATNEKNKRYKDKEQEDDDEDEDDKETIVSQTISDDNQLPSDYENNDDTIEGYTSSLAWLVVISVVLLNMTVNITWLSASSAPQVTSSWLNVSFSDLNWLANISAVVSALLSLPTAWSYERFGIKWNLLVAAFINVIGCWIRFISNFVPVHSRFWVVMLGQSIASISGPLVTNISTKLAAVWFAPKHRGIANTLTALSIAPAIAPIVIPIIAPVPENTPQMFLITAVFASIVAIIFPFLPHKPKIPPSFSATQSRTSVWEGMKMLVKNRDFIWLLIISSTGIGMASCFTVIIMEAIIPYGYTEQQAGLCVAVITISGFFGGGVTGYWLGKSNDPNTIIRMFTPLTIFSYVMFIYQIVPNAFSVLLIACVANGFFSYGLFNVYLELASEVTYPVPESVSSCCIAAGNSVTTFLFTVILDAFRAGPKAHPPHHMNTSLIVATIIVIVGSLPCLVLKGELKRLAVDQQLNQCKK